MFCVCFPDARLTTKVNLKSRNAIPRRYMRSLEGGSRIKGIISLHNLFMKFSLSALLLYTWISVGFLLFFVCSQNSTIQEQISQYERKTLFNNFLICFPNHKNTLLWIMHFRNVFLFVVTLPLWMPIFE